MYICASILVTHIYICVYVCVYNIFKALICFFLKNKIVLFTQKRRTYPMLVPTGSIFFSVMSGTTSLRGYCALTTKVKLRKYTGLQSSVWGRERHHIKRKAYRPIGDTQR